MKDSFDAYAISRGKNPQKMWEDVYDAIRRLALSKEKDIAEVAKRFGKKNLNFFELVRVDFTIDEDLNVFLMEANMSPNLSSAHFAPNQLLYEQVIFNFFALVGLAQRTSNNSLKPRFVHSPKKLLKMSKTHFLGSQKIFPESKKREKWKSRTKIWWCFQKFVPRVKTVFAWNVNCVSLASPRT